MKIMLAHQGRVILTASLLLGALLVPLLSIQNVAAQTPVSFLVSWTSSCPAGYTDTGLEDDSDGNVDLGEEDTTKTTRLCIKSADSNITLSSMWADYSCPAGWTFTGVTDDAGSISAPDDTPSNHSLGEKDYRPDTDRDHYAWCIKATGTASVTPFLDINWLYGSCPANSTAIVSQKSGNVLNLNTQELNSSKVWMCATLSEIVTPSPTANLSCSPSSLPSGGSCTLSWSSANATSCTGTNFSTGGATSGSVSTGPLTSSRSYSVTCTNSAGSASANTTVTVTGAPDLTAGGISPTTAVAGTSKTFFSTISNTGAASTGSTFSTLFQVSSNSSGSGASDVGVVTTATLAAGGSASASSGYTFSSTGTYYMRACADKSSASSSGSITESNESNNCGPWTAITVTAAATAPSGSCTVSPTSIAVGGSATWTASASGGNGSYTYAWATPGSTWTDNGSSRTSVYNTAGTYTAYVNITSNGVTTRVDCSTSVTVANTPPPSQPDLTAGGISPTSVTAGTSRTFFSTISNIGGASTGSGFITLFQVSANSSGSGASDVGIVTTATIAAGGSASVSSGYTFSSAGTYYMRACADKSSAASSGSITESNESNNCGPWTAITVSSASIPLSVWCYAAPSSIQVAESATWTASASGGNGSYTYTWSGTDGLSGSGSSITKQYNSVGTKTGSVTVTSGGQSTGARSCDNSVTVTDEPVSGPPDLIADMVSNTYVYTNQDTQLSSLAINAGGTSVDVDVAILYQKARDASGTGAADVTVGIATGPIGANGGSAYGPAWATFTSSDGNGSTVWVRACADKNSANSPGSITESDETNNCSPWKALSMITASPDLLGGDIYKNSGGQPVSFSNISAGVPVSILARVFNNGPMSVSSSFSNLLQRADSSYGNITDVSAPTGTGIGPNTYKWVSYSHTFPAPGTYYLRVCADKNAAGDTGSVAESNENNNCGSWQQVVVGNAPPSSGTCTVSTATLPATGGTVTYTLAPPIGLISFYWTGSDGYTPSSHLRTISRTFTSANNGNQYGMAVYGVTFTGTRYATSQCPVVTVGTVCSGTPTGTITGNPSRVRTGTASSLQISAVLNVRTSCTVSGPGVNTTYAPTSCSTTARNIATPAITAQSTYILTCDGTEVDRVIINILPNFTEF